MKLSSRILLNVAAPVAAVLLPSSMLPSSKYKTTLLSIFIRGASQGYWSTSVNTDKETSFAAADDDDDARTRLFGGNRSRNPNSSKGKIDKNLLVIGKYILRVYLVVGGKLV